MRRRPSIRATAAAVLLLLATTASGAVNAAPAPAVRPPNDEAVDLDPGQARSGTRSRASGGHGNMAPRQRPTNERPDSRIRRIR